MSAPLPILFIGHGSPLQAIEPSRYSAVWEHLGRTLPQPRAILVVSAHWYMRGSAVTAQPTPKTIHDFYGFPPALHAVQYPARGDPALAGRVAQLLQPTGVDLDHSRGLDHGAWSVLRYMYPAADVPVVQLSINSALTAPAHYALAQRLGALRDEGVLVLGSGNVVHNLTALQRNPTATAAALATEFNNLVRDRVLTNEHRDLLHYETFGAAAAFSVPTPEHYLPLLYVLALKRVGESVTIPVDGIDLGAISMLSVLIAA